MSKTPISSINKYLVWIQSGGRCQYRGCNKVLYIDILTKRNFNQSYIAHIVADMPLGPRGDKVRSSLLADDINNLMLMCDTHHRLIDKVDIVGHPEPLLLEMKREHEERINNATDIQPDRSSYVVTYSANIGMHTPNVSYQIVSKYLMPEYYPAKDRSIDLGIVNSLNKDSDPSFWETETKNLQDKFDRYLLPLIKSNEINHVSLFAFAPIPLLIKLGVLINDIVPMDVRQKIRTPDTWEFSADINVEYLFMRGTGEGEVALKIELSADISDDRIFKVVGNDACIYSIRIDYPSNDFVKSRKQIRDFGFKIREVLNIIKKDHGQDTTLHVFPATPIALAVQFGRVWMPKADMPLKIYDQNAALGGFVAAIDI